MPNPQNKPNADQPGCYDLIFRRPRTEVTAGEWAEIDIYITGYGKISGAKFYFMPPTSFIETNTCVIEHSLKMEDGQLRWGGLRNDGADDGVTIDFSQGGLRQLGWPNTSSFFDVAGGIATEKSLSGPPVKVKFQVKAKAGTGDHNLSFALTYFNDREWHIANRTAILHIPTLYERYEGWAWTVGIIVALITMITSIVAIFIAIHSGLS